MSTTAAFSFFKFYWNCSYMMESEWTTCRLTLHRLQTMPHQWMTELRRCSNWEKKNKTVLFLLRCWRLAGSGRSRTALQIGHKFFFLVFFYYDYYYFIREMICPAPGDFGFWQETKNKMEIQTSPKTSIVIYQIWQRGCFVGLSFSRIMQFRHQLSTQTHRGLRMSGTWSSSCSHGFLNLRHSCDTKPET